MARVVLVVVGLDAAEALGESVGAEALVAGRKAGLTVEVGRIRVVAVEADINALLVTHLVE